MTSGVAAASEQVLAGDVKWMRDKWRELMAKMYGVDSMPVPSPDNKRMDDVVAEMKTRLQEGSPLRKAGRRAGAPAPPPPPPAAVQAEPAAASPGPAAAEKKAEEATPQQAQPEAEGEVPATPASVSAYASDVWEDGLSAAQSPRSVERSQESASPSGRSLGEEEEGGRRPRWVRRPRRQPSGSPGRTQAGGKRSRADGELAGQPGSADASWDEAGPASRLGGEQSASSSSSSLAGSLPVQRMLEPELQQAAAPDLQQQQQQEQLGEAGLADGRELGLPMDAEPKLGIAAVAAPPEEDGGSAPATPPAREPSAQPFSLHDTPSKQSLARADDVATDGAHEQRDSLPASSSRPPGAEEGAGPPAAAAAERMSAEAPGPAAGEGAAVDVDTEALAARHQSHYEADVMLPPGREAVLMPDAAKSGKQRDSVDVHASAEEHAAPAAAGAVPAKAGKGADHVREHV